MSNARRRIAVLISGGGTTLRNLIAARDRGDLGVDIALVISSNPQARGLEYATAAGIPARVFSHREFGTPPMLSKQVFEACRSASVDLVVLGGFLRRLVVPPDFRGRVINIHPALLPDFCGQGMYGRRVHEAVLKAGVRETGCTVHFVDDEYDHGPVIAQRRVPVLPGDTAETLADRVFDAECELYPQVIQSLVDGRIEHPKN